MKKIRVVHYVCFDKKFIPQQIDFLNINFSDKVNQIFFVHGASDEYLNTAPANVFPFTLMGMVRFIVIAHLSDRVVFNGLFSRKLVVLFSLFPWLLHKAVWLIWGGDLYGRQYHFNARKDKILEWFKSRFCAKLHAIATPTLGDYKMAKEWYGGTAKYINAGCNIFNFEKSDLDNFVGKRKDNNIYRIQIGNSGDPTNEHMEALEMLGKYVSENIHVYVPLSYGDHAYSKQVIDKGKLLFGRKFTALTHFMSSDEYNKHLASIDVLILNHRRQQGFGNIVISLYLGGKVFLRRDVSTWKYLSDEMGCVLNETTSVRELTFQDFVSSSADSVKENRKAVSHLFDRQWQKSSWGRLYTD